MSKEKCTEYNKKWYEKHKNDPEYKAKQAANHKRWFENNRDKWYAYHNEYRRTHKKGVDNERREAD